MIILRKPLSFEKCRATSRALHRTDNEWCLPTRIYSNRREYSSKSHRHSALPDSLENRAKRLMDFYEDFIGLREVKEAQNKVIEAEMRFKDTQERRIGQQQRMIEIQKNLREIHIELDKTVRGEDRYLQLVTKEHAILKEDRVLLAEFRLSEKQEYDYFSQLSFYLRESHEKERAQAEKTKYWSIIGSVFGTILGIFGTTISNHYRMRQLRNLVNDATTETSKCKDIIIGIRDILSEQREPLEKSTNELSPMDPDSHLQADAEKLRATFRNFENILSSYQTFNVYLLSCSIIIPPLITLLFFK